MVSCVIRTGVLRFKKQTHLAYAFTSWATITIVILLPDLKSYVKYATLPSHINIVMIIYNLYTAFICLVKYMLSICNVFEMDHGMAAAIKIIVTLKTNRRLQRSRSSDTLLQDKLDNWPQFSYKIVFLRNLKINMYSLLWPVFVLQRNIAQ